MEWPPTVVPYLLCEANPPAFDAGGQLTKGMCIHMTSILTPNMIRRDPVAIGTPPLLVHSG